MIEVDLKAFKTLFTMLGPE
eukprot:gene26722-biopygen17227